MAPRKPVPVPIKCGGTAKHTGERCKRWAVPGSTVCKHHGAMGGRRGRAHAEDLHAARRIEAVVAATVGQAMLEMGYPAEVMESIGGRLPIVRPGEQSTSSADLITEADEQAALEAAMARTAEGLLRHFQDRAVEQPDPVADDIRHLEARPTPKRAAEAARLRHVREPALKSHDSHPAEPAPPPAEPEPEPRPAKRRHTANHLGIQPTRRTTT